MSGKSDEQPFANRTEASEPCASHPLDTWLRKQLRADAALEDDPLPVEIADLASQLERALADAASAGEQSGSRGTAPADHRREPKSEGGND